MKRKIYYKVVTNIPGAGFSSYDTLIGSRFNTFYKIGKKTYATIPNTRLFVCDSLEQARFFRSRDDLIFECHCDGIINNANGTDYMDYTDFWNKVNENLKKKKKWNTGIASHTIKRHKNVCFAKSVTLLKQLD